MVHQEPADKRLGKVGMDDWLLEVKSDLEARMARYEANQIEFAVLCIMKDPKLTAINDLARTIVSVSKVSRRQQELGLRPAMPCGDSLEGLDPDFGLTETALNSALPSAEAELLCAGGSIDGLAALHLKLLEEQRVCKTIIKDEQMARYLDRERARRRRHEYSPAIRAWLRFHAKKKLVRELLSTN